MPQRSYAVQHGNPHEFLQYVRLLEHSRDMLEFSTDWEVQAAFYGLPDHTVGRDVTNIVKAWWRGKRTIRASNYIFGDPLHGKRKVLDVTLYQVEWSYEDVDGGPWRRTWSFQYARHYFYNPHTGASIWSWPPPEK